MTGHRGGRRQYQPIVAGGLAAVAALALVLWLAGVGSSRSGSVQAGQSVSTTQQSTTGSTQTQTQTPTQTQSAPGSSSSPSATSASSSTHASPTKGSSATSGSSSAGSSASTSAGTATQSASNPSSVARPAGGHLITIVNAVDQTIWATTNPNAQHPIPQTSWRLDPGQSVTFAVPQGWGGRVWGKTGCSGGHCLSGDNPPATLAELTLDSFDGLDFYDVSLVDGSNLPMYINTSHRVGADPVSPTGCYQGACTKPIVCPGPMQVKAGGQVVACTTPCTAFGGDAYCCRGAWSGRENCDPAKWPVDYAKLVYKDAEPYAYSYAFDDSATMSCKGGCDYRIVFGVTPGSG